MYTLQMYFYSCMIFGCVCGFNICQQLVSEHVLPPRVMVGLGTTASKIWLYVPQKLQFFNQRPCCRIYLSSYPGILKYFLITIYTLLFRGNSYMKQMFNFIKCSFKLFLLIHGILLMSAMFCRQENEKLQRNVFAIGIRIFKFVSYKYSRENIIS